MEVSYHKLARDLFNLLALFPILASPTWSWTSSSELSFSYFHHYHHHISCQYRHYHSHSQYRHHGPHQPCQNQYIHGHYQYLHNVIKALTRLVSGIFWSFNMISFRNLLQISNLAHILLLNPNSTWTSNSQFLSLWLESKLWTPFRKWLILVCLPLMCFTKLTCLFQRLIWIDKAPRFSIRRVIWILLSDTETSAATPPGVIQKK